MDTIGSRIRHAREAANLSQWAAATELGVTKGALSAWENDRYLPQLDTFTRLCQLYRVQADAILFKASAVADESGGYCAVASSTARLQAWVASLDEERRQGLLQFLRIE